MDPRHALEDGQFADGETSMGRTQKSIIIALHTLCRRRRYITVYKHIYTKGYFIYTAP